MDNKYISKRINEHVLSPDKGAHIYLSSGKSYNVTHSFTNKETDNFVTAYFRVDGIEQLVEIAVNQIVSIEFH